MMKPKVATSLALAIAVLLAQVGTVFASPATQEAAITGTVTELLCDTDETTGVTTFEVTVTDAEGSIQVVRIDQLTAEALGLVTVDEDGNPDCSEEALMEAIGTEVEIDPSDVIPAEEEPKHPVGSALASFFSDITDYDAIMDAREEGFGFGVIAQALWMTRKLDGNNDLFIAILQAKESGDYSAFGFEGETIPENWGQFRKAVMEKEKGNLGLVMSGKDGDNGNGHGNSNNPNVNKGNNKDKGDKGNGKEKNKDKGKDK